MMMSYEHLVTLGTDEQMFQGMCENCVANVGLVYKIIFWVDIIFNGSFVIKSILIIKRWEKY